MSRPYRLVPRHAHVIVPHMQLSQNEALGSKYTSGRHLGAALTDRKPLLVRCCLTPLSITPFHASPELYFPTFQFPAYGLFSSAPCLGNGKFAHFCTLAKTLLQIRCGHTELSARMIYGIYPPSLPPGKIQFVPPPACLRPASFYIGLWPPAYHRTTLSLPRPLPHGTSAQAPDQNSRLTTTLPLSLPDSINPFDRFAPHLSPGTCPSCVFVPSKS